MPFFGSPSPPKVEAPPAPPQEDTSKLIDKQVETKQLSLARYLARTSGFGANELRGNGAATAVGTGIRP